MSKTVKLDDQVYLKLEDFRDKRETFSEAVERLLELPRRISELGNIVEGSLRFEELKHGPEKVRDLQVR